MSGARSLSQATAESTRCFTELTFHVAMRMARPGLGVEGCGQRTMPMKNPMKNHWRLRVGETA
jgi:hypothetical protein